MFTESPVNGLTFFERLFDQHLNSPVKAPVLVLNSLSGPSLEVAGAHASHAALPPRLAKGQSEKKGPLSFHLCCSLMSLGAFLLRN